MHHVYVSYFYGSGINTKVLSICPCYGKEIFSKYSKNFHKCFYEGHMKCLQPGHHFFNQRDILMNRSR